MITTVLCFGMAMVSREALLKSASQLTKRSIDPRQTCDFTSSLSNLPSDCASAITSFRTNPTSFPDVFCEARCVGPVIDVFNNCNFSNAILASCARNAAGQRCISSDVAQTLATTSGQITSNCATTIAGGTCTDACRNTLNTARQSQHGYYRLVMMCYHGVCT